MEGAGIVEAVGEGVTHLKEGDRAAYASSPPGSYCDGARDAGEERGQAARRDLVRDRRGDDAQGPDRAVPAAADACRRAACRPGDLVLFHAAAGGVGLIACQWAQGARPASSSAPPAATRSAPWRASTAPRTPSTTAREDFAARVKEITGGKGVKVVYDSVGKDTWDKSLDCLRPFGLMASFGNASGRRAAVPRRHARGQGLALRDAADALHPHRDARGDAGDGRRAVRGGRAAARSRSASSSRYALADAAQAHRDLEARKTTGSSVLIP